MKGAKLSRKSKRSRSFKSSNSSSLNKSELKKRRTTEQRSVKRKRSQSSNESVQEGVQEGVQENTTIISLKLKKGNNISPVLNNLQIIYDFYIESILDYTYYLVQIADEDVNVIAPFINDQNAPVSQNERFSLIRWGSQVDLVLPLDERYDFDLVLPDEMHVNAGLDKLVKINFKNDPFQQHS